MAHHGRNEQKPHKRDIHVFGGGGGSYTGPRVTPDFAEVRRNGPVAWSAPEVLSYTR